MNNTEERLAWMRERCIADGKAELINSEAAMETWIDHRYHGDGDYDEREPEPELSDYEYYGRY